MSATRPLFLSIFICLFLVNHALALTVNYAYEGNKFTDIEGEPDSFSPDDRVSAKFIVDCEAAHWAGDCANLPFDNYFELGAVVLEPESFTAGSASLPDPDGSVLIGQRLLIQECLSST